MTRAFAVAAALAVAAPAAAGPIIGIQTDFVQPLGGAEELGTAFAGTLGYGIDVGLLEVVPEVGISRYSSQRTLPRAGGRVMLGKVLEPGVYAHAVFADGLSLAPGRGGWDAGAVLDFTAVPHFDIGVQAGVLSLPGQRSQAAHFATGLHMALVF